MKTLIIAESTARQTRRQPVLFLIVGLAGAMIFLLRFITQFTFGQSEQLSMMVEMGISTITMSGLLYTVFASSLAITEDLDRRSAITVLCKPVHRYEYILGKFLGISFTIVLVYVVLTIILFVTLWLANADIRVKDMFSQIAGFPVYFRQSAVPVLKGIVLSYFEILLLNAISLAAATRLPMILNLAVCAIVFLLGNLTDSLMSLLIRGVSSDPQVVAAASWWQLVQDYPSVAFARVLYVLIPNLESFNISSAVAYGVYVSPSYVVMTVAYGLVYTAIALLTALVSFEHRELM